MKQICESCGRKIHKPAVAFRMKIELMADPSAPEFTAEDFSKDIREEMRDLIKEMSRRDPRELEDEVYECYLFTLCRACRGKIHRALRDQHIPFDVDDA